MAVVMKKLEVYPSGYVESDSLYSSISNIENSYNSSDNTTYATIKLNTTGTITFYYTFDLSSIPQDATILSVSCKAKIRSEGSSKAIRLCYGTTGKGASSTTVTTSVATYTLDAGTWTREELDDCRLKLYASQSVAIYFYGATLTVEYEVEEASAPSSYGYVNIVNAWKERVGGYTNIGGIWKERIRRYVNVAGIWKETFAKSSGSALSQLALGSSVYMKRNGVAENWLIVHKGLPNVQYDATCNGIWLLKNDIDESRILDSDSYDYATSELDAYLNGDFLNSFDTSIAAIIKKAKIPYFDLSSNAGKFGADGLTRKVFLLAMSEMGDTFDGYDGYMLDYFKNASNDKRIAYMNGTATTWRTRTYADASSMYITATGKEGYGNYNKAYGMRPTVILPPTTLVDDNMNVTVSQSRLTVCPSSFTNQSFPSVSNERNGFAFADNTTYATLTTSTMNTVYGYFNFDLSAIPESATVTSVTCEVKARTQMASLPVSNIYLTVNGTDYTIKSGITSTETIYSFTITDIGDSILADLKVKISAISMGAAASVYFYGATLTVEFIA